VFQTFSLEMHNKRITNISDVSLIIFTLPEAIQINLVCEMAADDRSSWY
jgi:hypothetical protein